MGSYLMFWISKALVEFGIALGIILFAVVVGILIQIPSWIRQARCKHDGNVYETQACDAYCQQCGKNLGFIGAWREKRAAASAAQGGDSHG
ncbi:hypothetical protein [Ralstonia sp. Ralssp135]|uniref:hypothetical protein n=1 Tax=Ralstonia sp. Ralssp135 TaxID=3243016 RepID=UPI0039B0D572